MDILFLAMAGFLLLNIVAGIVLLARSRALGGQVLIIQLFGTMGVGILLLLAAVAETAALRDVALIFALLSGMAAIAFTSRGQAERIGGGRHD